MKVKYLGEVIRPLNLLLNGSIYLQNTILITYLINILAFFCLKLVFSLFILVRFRTHKKLY